MKDSLIKGLHLKVGLRHTFKEAQPRNLSKTMMAAAFILKKTKQSAIQKDLREWPQSRSLERQSLEILSAAVRSVSTTLESNLRSSSLWWRFYLDSLLNMSHLDNLGRTTFERS